MGFSFIAIDEYWEKFEKRGNGDEYGGGKMKIIIATLMLLFAVTGSVYAQSAKEAYELEERCNKRAIERFKSQYGDGLTHYNSELNALTSYTTHYNRKLNKCLVLISASFVRAEKEKQYVLKRFIDVNENIELGMFANLPYRDRKITCFVFGEECYSESEWDSAVRPYMKE